MGLSNRYLRFLSLGFLSAITMLFQNCSTGETADAGLPPIFQSAKGVILIEGSTSSITIGLAQPASSPIEYKWTIVGDNVARRFRQSSGTILIPVGGTSGALTLESLDDALFDEDKTFVVGFEALKGGASLSGNINLTVKERLPAPSLTGQNAMIEGGKVGFVDFEIENRAAFNMEFYVSTFDGSAIAGRDFLGLQNVRVLIPAGEKKVSVRLDTLDAGLLSGDRTFVLRAVSSSRIKIDSASQSTVRLYNRSRVVDSATVEIAGAEAKEGEEAKVKIFLNQALPFDVRVNYAMISRSAMAGLDYQKQDGQAVVPAGQTQALVAVKTLKDNLFEGQIEDLELVLSAPENAKLGSKSSAQVKIIDFETEPELAVTKLVNGSEGGKAQIQMKLNYKTASEAEFVWSTSEGTAKNIDYTAVSNAVVKIPAGQDTVELEIPIASDNLAEPEEEFFINLAGFKNAKPKTAKIPVKIMSGTLPVVNVVVAPAQEGQNAEARFTLNRTNPNADVVINWHTALVAGADAATVQDVFLGRGQVMIPRGQLTAFAYIPTYEDNLDENNERFSLNIDSASNAERAQAQLISAIVDNDLPAAIITQVSHANEGANAVVRARLSKISGREVKIYWSTFDITAKSGADYVAKKDAVAVIPAGGGFVDLPVATLSDNVDEVTEAFEVRITKVEGAQISTVDASKTVQLINSDPVISVVGSSVSEGGVMTFLIRLSFPSREDTKLRIQTANGSAVAPGDYTPIALTEILIPAGQTQRAIQVSTKRDSVAESDETVRLILSNPIGLRLPAASVTTLGTILGNL